MSSDLFFSNLCFSVKVIIAILCSRWIALFLRSYCKLVLLFLIFMLFLVCLICIFVVPYMLWKGCAIFVFFVVKCFMKIDSLFSGTYCYFNIYSFEVSLYLGILYWVVGCYIDWKHKIFHLPIQLTIISPVSLIKACWQIQHIFLNSTINYI